jgi:hypothetical protein
MNRWIQFRRHISDSAAAIFQMYERAYKIKVEENCWSGKDIKSSIDNKSPILYSPASPQST